MEQKKYLDLEGLKHYNGKLKDGTIVVGKATAANTVPSTGIQWGSDTVPLVNIPKVTLERCYVVANDTARFALTTTQVQNGDTVKVSDTNKMYFIKDDTKLNNENGYEPYTSGTSVNVQSIDWANVTNKPTKFTPEDHGSNVVTKLDGYTPMSNNGEYNKIVPGNSLNEALLMLQQNTDRMFKTINITELNNPISSTSERFKQLVSDNYVIQYTLVCDVNDKKMPCGVLYEFSDSGKTNITQVAITSLLMDKLPTMSFDMHTTPTMWSRRFKVRNYSSEQLNKWSAWEPCMSNNTMNFIKDKIMIKFDGIVNNVNIQTQSITQTNGSVVFDEAINKLLYKVGFNYYQVWSTSSLYGVDGLGQTTPFENVLYCDMKNGGIYIWDGTNFKSMFNKTVAITTTEIDNAING